MRTAAEPIESEVKVNVPMTEHLVRQGGRTVAVQARVPKRCMRVWHCLAGHYFGCEPALVRETGWWRVIDLQVCTGHSCEDRKLRELRELNPGLIQEQERRGHASRYKVYRLCPDGQSALF